MKKAPVSVRTQRADSLRGTTSFYRPVRDGLRILSYPLRCIGRPRLSYSRKGFSLLLRRVFRKEDSGRLSPAGGSLNGLAFSLLDLLHRTDRILCKPVSVKMLNNERTIMNCEL